VRGRTLLFIGDDGKKISLTLKDSDAMRSLGEALVRGADDVDKVYPR
jgi:hypothetical protein